MSVFRCVNLLVVATALLAGCSSKVHVFHTEPADANTVYVHRNDTFALRYDFWAPYGIMRFTVTNQQRQRDLCIDWPNSYFAIDSMQMDYRNELESPPTSLGPGQSYMVEAFYLYPKRPHRFNSNALQFRDTTFQGERVRAKFLHFQSETSPIRFTNRVQFRFCEPGDTREPFYLTDNFYVSDVLVLRNGGYHGFYEDPQDSNFRDPHYFFAWETTPAQREAAGRAAVQGTFIALDLLMIVLENAGESDTE